MLVADNETGLPMCCCEEPPGMAAPHRDLMHQPAFPLKKSIPVTDDRSIGVADRANRGEMSEGEMLGAFAVFHRQDQESRGGGPADSGGAVNEQSDLLAPLVTADQILTEVDNMFHMFFIRTHVIVHRPFHVITPYDKVIAQCRPARAENGRAWTDASQYLRDSRVVIRRNFLFPTDKDREV